MGTTTKVNRNFQIPVTYEASGYVMVRAKTPKAAKEKVRSLMVGMDYEGCDANTDMMPFTPDLFITGEPQLVEEKEDE